MDDYHSKLSFLENLLGKSKYSQNTKEMEIFCPFCFHHKRKLSINLRTDAFQCWICGKKGRSIAFLLKKAGASGSIKEYLDKFSRSKFDQKFTKNDDFQLFLPKEFTPIVGCSNSVLGQKAIKYLTKVRGIDEIDVLRHKIGTAMDGQFADSIIFPSFDKRGLANFFSARHYDGRKRGPFVPKGYRSQIVPNELNINWRKPVTIVESFTDLLKTTGNTIPLFGSFLNERSKIFYEIVMSGCEVVLALDADAKKKSFDIAQNFMGYDVSCYSLNVHPFEDVGAMMKSEFVSRSECAKLFTHNDIFRKRLELVC